MTEDDAIDAVLASIKTPDFASFNRDSKPFFRYDFTRRNDGSIRAEEVKPDPQSAASADAQRLVPDVRYPVTHVMHEEPKTDGIFGFEVFGIKL